MLTAVVDLPTPPLPEATAMIASMPGTPRFPDCVPRGAVGAADPIRRRRRIPVGDYLLHGATLAAALGSVVLVAAPEGPLDVSRLEALAAAERCTDRFLAVD